MSLNYLLQRKQLVVLGLNSGTSADGLDLAVVRISRRRSSCKTTFLDGFTIPYSKALGKSVLDMADSEFARFEDIVYLDNLLGHFYGEHASAFISDIATQGVKIDLVASHGQTVCHLPKKLRISKYNINGTLQLGSLDQIAAHTGLPVVGNFRQADIAGGGEGAPITTGAMRRLFGKNHSRLIINIGGMSNFFYLPGQNSSLPLAARDCGPGNILSDILAQRLFRKPFDRNGQLARKGRISQRLLSLLLAEPFFNARTASTGREEFGVQVIQKMIEFGENHRLKNDDLVATAAQLTVIAITKAVKQFLKNDISLSKLYLTGGGRNNIFFREKLQQSMPDLEVCLIDDLGIDGDFVEATSYAVLGEACIRTESLAGTTGGKMTKDIKPVLGHIAQPPE
ncbi:MAG: anhydro-N-acetylmuramic acid kinase [candidate division Zixibacteria bacterium]|nr:anhydro-N-acetylmuramic acid kinase [candidate division Zixibacteria bacterium]